MELAFILLAGPYPIHTTGRCFISIFQNPYNDTFGWGEKTDGSVSFYILLSMSVLNFVVH